MVDSKMPKFTLSLPNFPPCRVLICHLGLLMLFLVLKVCVGFNYLVHVCRCKCVLERETGVGVIMSQTSSRWAFVDAHRDGGMYILAGSIIIYLLAKCPQSLC